MPGDELGVEVLAVLSGEHKALIDVPGSPCRSLLGLRQLVPQQAPDGGVIEVDAAILAARCLRPADRRLVTELHDLLANRQEPTLQLDVDPAQSDRLAAPEACHSDQLVESTESIPHCVVEELAELLGFPRPDSPLRGFGQLDVDSRVDRDPLLFHRRV